VILTRRQRNDIFETLSKKGVDPADCELDERPGGPGVVSQGVSNRWPETHVSIFHPSARSTFALRIEHHVGSKNPSRYHFDWWVHDGAHSGGEERACKDWEGVLEQLAYWADEVQYVIDTPDFWEELQQVPEIMATAQAAEASNAPFTPDEQAEISRRLDEIKNLVREKFELTDEQLSVIDQRLDDAEEASKRLGRKDWLMAFYGAVISTFMTDEIPPHVIQTIVSTVLHGIAHLFGIGGPPPIITA
jgi:hypothetical protein